MGDGVLAIWNGIAPAADHEFVAWHVREHIPERVSLPGFIRGRRYVAIDGPPEYFNFYETQTAAILQSPPYLARLNAPTEWTRRVVANFTDTSRTICDIAWSMGLGEGGFIEAVVLKSVQEESAFAERLRRCLGPAYRNNFGLVGIHLLRGHTETSKADTVEAKLRGVPDKVAPWILLVEACTPEFFTRFRNGEGASGSLSMIGTASVLQRSIYQIQFALTKMGDH
jgi:hypothetical protein